MEFDARFVLPNNPYPDPPCTFMVFYQIFSPCPKLKPVTRTTKAGFLEVATQPYGGGLWHTWFDRDLGVAGRAIVKRGEGKYSHDLVRDRQTEREH